MAKTERASGSGKGGMGAEGRAGRQKGGTGVAHKKVQRTAKTERALKREPASCDFGTNMTEVLAGTPSGGDTGLLPRMRNRVKLLASSSMPESRTCRP
eukprot:6183459-Pleurochrysis_carterae.AAC.2